MSAPLIPINTQPDRENCVDCGYPLAISFMGRCHTCAASKYGVQDEIVPNYRQKAANDEC